MKKGEENHLAEKNNFLGTFNLAESFPIGSSREEEEVYERFLIHC